MNSISVFSNSKKKNTKKKFKKLCTKGNLGFFFLSYKL